ncbi:BTB domain-containing protein [Mycena indigotica]|uniref:BTB domain-containing protein n=1 Tax=Mycena indigotica TaxID=2126181 RepID=A0A8H6W2J4_9AGAR|nr:BTB domain-containing protein [Mycena indigotica]KAF7299328.1 BTB domain-containing protein [Mycena indigotica]
MSTSDSEPPAKRQRRDMDEDEDDHPLIIHRSNDYWFEDGNVILQVQQTQFRLSKSILSMHSPIFRDMFSLSLPENEPLCEGCPVVVLPGDASEDWEHLLGVIFPKDCFAFGDPHVDQVSAILRLSKKYDLAGFRKHCVERLKAEFPTKLLQFDNVIKSWTNICVNDDDGPKACVQVVNLARELGLYSILPTAFYNLIHYSEGIHGDSLVMMTDKEDRRVSLEAYIKMVRSYTNTPLKWLAPKSGISWDACTSPSRCSSERKEILIELLSQSDKVASILRVWNNQWDTRMCEGCVTKAQEVFETARKDCWEKLPSYFGLEDWETLQKMDFE